MHPFIRTAALAVTLATAAPAADFKIETWHDRSVELEEFRTFDWLSTPLGATARRLRGQLNFEDRLRDHVSRQLAARGYVEKSEGKVDFLVTYEFLPPPLKRWSPHVLQPVRCSRLRTSFSFGGSATTDHENLLYLEFRDPATDMPVWRGRALRLIAPKEDPEERLALAVKQILELFPPPKAAD